MHAIGRQGPRICELQPASLMLNSMGPYQGQERSAGGQQQVEFATATVVLHLVKATAVVQQDKLLPGTSLSSTSNACPPRLPPLEKYGGMATMVAH